MRNPSFWLIALRAAPTVPTPSEPPGPSSAEEEACGYLDPKVSDSDGAGRASLTHSPIHPPHSSTDSHSTLDSLDPKVGDSDGAGAAAGRGRAPFGSAIVFVVRTRPTSNIPALSTPRALALVATPILPLGRNGLVLFRSLSSPRGALVVLPRPMSVAFMG